jgi:hypothetical protein
MAIWAVDLLLLVGDGRKAVEKSKSLMMKILGTKVKGDLK